MKYFSFTSLLICSLFLGQKANAQDLISITYGSAISGSTLSLFSNEANVGFDSTTTGLISIGYFTDGFDISTGKGTIADSASLSSFLGNFNKIDSKDFNTAIAPGFLTAASGSITATGDGKSPYIITLAGVTDWANAASATEIGLFRDDSMGTIPSGAQPIPTDFFAESVIYGTVEIGDKTLGQVLDGAFTGFNGNIYASQAIGAAVPEPSTYALFLGVFSLGFVIWRKRAVKNTATE
jgi:hypothetical protein